MTNCPFLPRSSEANKNTTITCNAGAKNGIFAKDLKTPHNMTSVTGTYFNGQLQLEHPITTQRPIKVTILFEEEPQKALSLSDFSFLETQELLANCNTSFSDEVIDERRSAL